MGIEELLNKLITSNEKLSDLIIAHTAALNKHEGALKAGATEGEAAEPAAAAGRKPREAKGEKGVKVRYSPDDIQKLMDGFKEGFPDKSAGATVAAFRKLMAPILGTEAPKGTEVLLAVAKHNEIGDALTAAIDGFAQAAPAEDEEF